MYCYVQYKCDGEKVIVPSSFVKKFDDLHIDHDKLYEVFWSPNPDDTPLKILAKQNKIITVDNEVETARKKKNASPIPGNYFAKILMVADTEKELESIIDSKEGRNRKTKNKSVKDISETKQKVNKVSELIKKGKKRSYENLKLQTVFSDSDSDDSIIPLKIHKGEMLELKKENRILKEKNVKYKTKYDNLKEKYNEISNLNIALQKRLLNPTESSLSLSENAFTDAPSPTIFTVAPSPIASPLSTPIYPQLNSIPASVVDDAVPENLPEPAIPSMEYLEEPQFKLDESHFNRVILRVKPGPPGDSLFVKNLASAVFGDDVLMTSSVTGSKCNAKRDSVAKPALCPKRLHYIKELLNERITREIPECPIAEKEKRLSKLNSLIAEKIATLSKKK